VHVPEKFWNYKKKFRFQIVLKKPADDGAGKLLASAVVVSLTASFRNPVRHFASDIMKASRFCSKNAFNL
jgi:hypothetical protein